MARYQVPQNIDMEDKIVGPLTMLQFVYLMVGGMIIYLAWTLFDLSLFFVIAIPVGLLALAMAFIKVQDQPFPKFIAAFILYLVRPKSRVWQKEEQLSSLKLVKKTNTGPAAGPDKHLAHEGTAELASVIDLGQPATQPSAVSSQPSVDQSSITNHQSPIPPEAV